MLSIPSYTVARVRAHLPGAEQREHALPCLRADVLGGQRDRQALALQDLEVDRLALKRGGDGDAPPGRTAAKDHSSVCVPEKPALTGPDAASKATSIPRPRRACRGGQRSPVPSCPAPRRPPPPARPPTPDGGERRPRRARLRRPGSAVPAAAPPIPGQRGSQLCRRGLRPRRSWTGHSTSAAPQRRPCRTPTPVPGPRIRLGR
jgi:hypothetical protein